MKLDPAPTKPQYDDWAQTATRPLTQAPIGAYTAPRRHRSARLSKLWTPERTLRMFRRPVITETSSVAQVEGELEAGPAWR